METERNRKGTWNLLKLVKHLREAFAENQRVAEETISCLQTTRFIAIKPPPSATVESLDECRSRLRSIN